MKRPRRWGNRWSRAVGPAALLVSLAIPQVAVTSPLVVAAAAALPGRPDLSTYAGAPAAGKPTEVAQQPYGLAVFGRYTFVADPANHVVRLLIDNTEVAFAGSGSLAVGGGSDPAKAQLAGPYAVAIGEVKKNGYQVTGFDVYIADTFGHQVRKAAVTIPSIDNPIGVQKAEITTIAGDGSFGFAGDHGSASTAKLNSPYGIAWDQQRGIVYIADTLNNRVRSIEGGIINTVVAAPLNQPRGLAVNGDGLYIADTYNNVVRRFDLTTHLLTTVAGTGSAGYNDGVKGTSALLKQPTGLAFDDKANLYIADTGNNVVRELSAQPDHALNTVAGTGQPGEFGDGGPAILAQLTAPTAVAVRPNGDVVIADTGNNLVRVLEGSIATAPGHNIHIEAGNKTASFAGDGQQRIHAQFAEPAAVLSKIVADETLSAAVPHVTGQRYVIDTFNHAVRTFGTDTDVSTLAGMGGARGPGISAIKPTNTGLAYPMGGALDATRKVLYIADTFNNVVRAIDLTNQTMVTVAGTGTAGYASSDEGKPATQAALSYPTGLAVDAAGNLFIADTYNSRVREVVAGRIYTVAGTGQLGFSGDNGDARLADLYFPYGVALDNATPPNLYITDSFNHRIRRVSAVSPNAKAPNLIQTVAGDGAPAFADGGAAQAHFNRPWSATVDQGSVYVADYLNHRVRRVDVAGQAVTTLGGVGTTGLTGDAGPAETAEVDAPRGLSMLGDSGAMLVADSFNSRVRWLGVSQAGIQRTQVTFDPTNLAGRSQPQSVTVTSTGSGLLVMGAVDLGDDRNNFYLDPLKNTCAQARLEPAKSCSFEVAFQPRATLGSHSGSVVIPNDAIGGQQLITLKGEATAPLVTLSPPAVVINQPINAAATPAVVTMTNNGEGLLQISSIALDKGVNSDFAQSNNCPGMLAGHGSCQITITLSQIGADDKKTRSDTLTIRDDAGHGSSGGASQSVPLTGSLAQAAATFTSQSLIFTQNLGSSSGSETIRLVNTGQAPMHLSAIREDGDFSQTNNCPPVLAPGASCAITITFVPSTLGERDGYIVVADDSADSPQRIQVMGVATMALAHLGPDRLNFSQNVGAGGGPQTVTLTNRGDGPLSIFAIAATGDFKATPHCPQVLLPGMACSIGVTFAPQAPGARSGSLIVTDDANAAPGSTDTVRLTGFGYLPVATLSAAVLAPGANVGGTATPQVVTVTNTGNGALTIRNIGISGAAAGDYTQSSTCLRAIAPGASCAITINFAPRGYGVRAANLTLYDDGAGGTQLVSLRGTGTAARPLVSSGFVNFGGAGVGSPTLPQRVVLFNAGNGLLSIGSIGLSGDDFAMSTSCGSTLAAGASCTISVTFLPQGSGARSGMVTITDNAGAQRITLSGVGT
jgi:sugar lactone lactonase YvrE